MQSSNASIEEPARLAASFRSSVYAFLCRSLAYPNVGHILALTGDILPSLSGFEQSATTAAAVQEVSAALPRSLNELRAAHTSVFTLTVSADCPDYETAYGSRDIFQQANAMADVGGFYKAHGLLVGGVEQERPDHIATELEFMSFLTLKEAYAAEHAESANLNLVRRDQAYFLRDHLGCWGPEFGRRLEARAQGSGSYFAAVGRALERWLQEECERLEVTPASTKPGTNIQWAEPDDGSCAAAGDCPLISIDEIGTGRW